MDLKFTTQSTFFLYCMYTLHAGMFQQDEAIQLIYNRKH